MNKASFFNSIRTRLPLIFMGLMFAVIVSIVLVNSFFLEKVYFNNKCDTMLQAYEEIKSAAGSDSLEDNSFTDYITDICEIYNLRLYIIDVNSKSRYVSKNGGRELESRLLSYIFADDDNQPEVIVEDADYVLQRTSYLDRENLEMFGRLDTGMSFIMSTPLETTSESAKLANRFYMLTGLIFAVIGAVIIFLASGKIVKPILELDKISERMVSLDFEAKADFSSNPKNKDEIDILSENMNKMSLSLEKTISELKSANAKLENDIKAKEETEARQREFISAVSHELKTPLALVRGYAEGLKDGIAEDPDSVSYYCDVIMDESEKMSNMVTQLLNLDELESGREAANIERIDLQALVENNIKQSEIMYKSAGITVKSDIQPHVCVWADEFLAEEIFTNYFSNACHYCEGDKIIEIKTEVTDTHVKLSVFNTGSPIPEDSVNNIWNKFYKVDKARTRSYGGSGVGLSIVKAICESLCMDYGSVNYTNGVLFYVVFERA